MNGYVKAKNINSGPIKDASSAATGLARRSSARNRVLDGLSRKKRN